MMKAPLKISALCMLSGGDAVGGARSAPSTRTNMIANRLPLKCGVCWSKLAAEDTGKRSKEMDAREPKHCRASTGIPRQLTP